MEQFNVAIVMFLVRDLGDIEREFVGDMGSMKVIHK